VAQPSAPDAVNGGVAPPETARVLQVLGALGGAGNVQTVTANASRLCIEVCDPATVDERALRDSVRALGRPSPASLHLVVGPAAGAWLVAINASLRR
jgi:phosphotransferase system IIB component